MIYLSQSGFESVRSYHFPLAVITSSHVLLGLAEEVVLNKAKGILLVLRLQVGII